MNNKKKNSGETLVSFSLYKKYRIFSQHLVRNMISTFFLYVLLISNASSEPLNHGFNELGETVVNIIGDNGAFPQKNDWDGLAFNVSKTNSSSQCKSANQKFPLTTMGGYTGYEFSPGFLLVLYSGTLSGSRTLYSNGSSQNYSYSFSFSSMGVLSPTTNTESAWCADPRKTYNLGTSAYPVAPNGQTMGSVKTGIYVSSSVSANTSVTVPSYYINRGRPSDTGQGGPLIKGTGQSYNIAGDKLNCTISAPPAINFGTVNLWNFAGNSTGSPGGARKDVLASVDGNLSISCNSDSPDDTAIARLTLKGPTQGYTNDLKMTMDSTGNVAPATVRASFVNISSTCNTSGPNFGPGNSGVPGNEINIGQLGVGSNDIPYRFFLCALPDAGINQFGSASAQATITLDWN